MDAARCPATTSSARRRTGTRSISVTTPAHFGPIGADPAWADIHTGTDGSNGGSRIAAAGYSPLLRWGEMVYWAPGPPGNTEQATIDWWMNSPGHRAKIEDCLFKEVGIGLLYPGGITHQSVI